MAQNKLLDDLRDDLAKGEVLLVVGTGVSIQATGGQPCAQWDGLIADGIEYCVGRRLLSEEDSRVLREPLAAKNVDDLLSVAEKVSQALGAPEGGEFRRWLRDSVGKLELKDRGIIDAIHALGTTIATTNYDDLLTRGLGIAHVPWTEGAAAHEFIRGDREGVLHFHGCADHPESVVLGIRSYEDVLENHHAQAIQQAVVANHTLLFIGCGDGLSDPNFGALLKWSFGTFGKSIYRHYCLCRTIERESLEKQHPPGERLFFIEYGERFEDLEPFLRRELVRSRTAAPPLPSPVYCFGRDREVAEVVSVLLADDPQPLPILGGPGMGKTTIVLKALHDKSVKKRYGARRWFVRCDGVRSRTNLAAAIARALDIAITPAVEQTVLVALTTAPGALVLDNGETPLDADVTQVEEFLSILAAIQSLALLVTIRGHKRPRSVPWRVGIVAERLTENAARDTFLAVAGKSQFANDPLLPHLLSVLDGVPLAITLMARFAEIFDSLDPVWSRWQAKRTEVLKDNQGTDRLNNIAVSYELSIGVLSLGARRLLSVLGMLPNGIAHLDLEGIFADPNDPADELRRRALVLDEECRLRMLAPLREYVAAAHPPPAPDAHRAVVHYLSLAGNEGNKLGKAGGADAVTRLAPEVANTEAMLIRSVRESDLRATTSVYGWSEFMRFTGLGSTGPIEQIANQALATGFGFEAAQYLEMLGNIALWRSDHEKAHSRFAHALSLFHDAGEVLGEANCISRIGEIALRGSDHETASRQFEQALRLFHECGDVLGEGNCIYSLGRIALRRSDLENACIRFEQALILLQTARDLLGQANCIHSLGIISLGRADFENARTHFEQALPLYQKVGAGLGEANCIKSLGNLEFERTNYETARVYFEKAMLLFQATGDSLGEANCIKSLGDIAYNCMDHEMASSRFEQALPLYNKVGNLVGEANCIRSLGDIALAADKLDEAKLQYLQALALYERLPEPFSIGATHGQLAHLATKDAARTAHIAAARAAWRSIKRYDLVARLDAEFGTDDVGSKQLAGETDG